MNEIAYLKSVPITKEVDVCIVGAGPAGMAAAVTAARAGRSVYLAEAHSCPGGMSTAGLVPVFMCFTDGINFLSGGFGKEISDRLDDTYSRHDISGLDGINAEDLKRIYEDMLVGACVDFTYHTTMIDAILEGTFLRTAIFNAVGKLFAVSATTFIDATGDGRLASTVGAEFMKSDESGEMMPSTLCSLWTGIDWDAFVKGGARSHDDNFMPKLLAKAIADGILSQEDYHHTGFVRNSRMSVGGNISHCFGTEPDDIRSLTDSYVLGRRLLAEYAEFYRRYVPGCQQAEIITSGSLLGVREGRRILGEYILNYDDYKARRTFPDEIGRYNFGVDIHPSRLGLTATLEHKEEFRDYACKKGESYGIPYRILVPRKINGLLSAGRCVSADRKVFASLRVMPGCYITGMAAGMAAALAAETETPVRSINVTELQRRLKLTGAFLPNFAG